ncbi:hypothetical protein LTR37_001208 [Vermiconidia calcicola]|uniref:Uncharacterized protein n=1 Tax=Vermiconidia calcicola TaxID=1690605 RepID=A0ACC3NWE7_9PEZI|nr:hypothetical protein LTR37_001208 [Vermiconidia calcicola]
MADPKPLARNKTFQSERGIGLLRHTETLRLDNDRIHGPISSLNPTQARFELVPASKHDGGSLVSNDDRAPLTTSRREEAPTANVAFKWTSRNNRKGRHALTFHEADGDTAHFTPPPPTNGAREILKGIRRMLTECPVWDISYLVAVCFTVGSMIWVINAFFVFLPYANHASKFPGEILYGGGITAFIGSTVFMIGSILLMLEAVNENRAGCFG